MNLSDLHPHNPYEGYDYNDLPYAPFVEWGSTDENFDRLIIATVPDLIIEVGTWKGGSANHMAKLTKQHGLNTKIVCVDTWLGSLEMWLDQGDMARYRSLNLKHGYPSLYYTFLSNVMYEGNQDIIIPFPIDSRNAAHWFARKNIKAKMIYIDASHEYQDVLDDLNNYWPLVEDGGVMFGDDWETWADVKLALDHFSTFDWLTKFRKHDSSESLNVHYTPRQWEIWKK